MIKRKSCEEGIVVEEYHFTPRVIVKLIEVWVLSMLVYYSNLFFIYFIYYLNVVNKINKFNFPKRVFIQK